MKRLRLAVIYTALTLMANAAAAAELSGYKAGEMSRLVLAGAPGEPASGTLLDRDDNVSDLTDYRGRVILVNFWATWCMPCRVEMPSLDRLQAQLGGEDFAVVPVATGRNDIPAIDRFYAEAGLTALPVLRDPRQALARDMAVMGLPVSVLLDRQGREIARLTGDAVWDGPDALALIRAAIAGE